MNLPSQRIKNLFNLDQGYPYLKVFLIVFFFGFAIFLPFVIANNFTLPLHGDYYLQQIPFYYEIHDFYWHFFTTGKFQLWSYENFLGVNFIAANAYYYLTSPFTIIIILTPRFLLIQALFFTLIIKLACGGMFFYILLTKYFKISKKTSLIGALVYAYSGWTLIYLWFNLFADVVALFPLILIGAERLINKKSGFVLTLSLFLMGITNYYFLFTFAITNSLYIFFRVIRLKMKFKNKLKLLIKGGYYFLLGILLSSFIILTAYNLISLNPRLDNQNYLIDFFNFFTNNTYKEGNKIHFGNLKSIFSFLNFNNLKNLFKHLFVFKNSYNYLYVISGFFFINISNFDTLLFKNSFFDNMISSMFITTPLILLIIPQIIDDFKQKKYGDLGLFFILLVSPFIPLTYYLLHGFSISYGRWQIFLMTLTLIYALRKLDNLKSLTKFQIITSFTISMFFMIFATVYCFNSYALEGMRLSIAIGQIFYFIIIFVVYYFKDDNGDLRNTLTFFILSEILVSTAITVTYHGYYDYNDLFGSNEMMAEQKGIINYINDDLDDHSFYRIYNDLADRNNVNLPMILNYNGLSTFHSVYSYQSSDFINSARVNFSKNNWSMGLNEKRYILETFLNVKYYILYKTADNLTTNLPSDYPNLKCWEYFCLYQNPNHIELGYSYDTIIKEDQFDLDDYGGRHRLALDQAYLYYPIVGEDFDEIYSQITPAIYNSLPSFSYRHSDYYYHRFLLNQYQSPVLINSIPFGENGKSLILANDIIEIIPNSPVSANSIIYLNLPLGPNALVSMYTNKSELLNSDNYQCDQTQCLILEDNHSINYYSKDYDHKYVRGYFANYPISSIKIKFLEMSSSLLYLPQINYISYSYYLNGINNLKQYPLENIEYSDNKVSFTTNFPFKRLILLSIPYDNGWKLKVNNKDAKIYKLSQGFIGLISDIGQSQYQLVFSPPGFKTGLTISLFSGFLLMISLTIENRNKIISYLKKVSKEIK